MVSDKFNERKTRLMTNHGMIRASKRLHNSKVAPSGPYKAGLHRKTAHRRVFSLKQASDTSSHFLLSHREFLGPIGSTGS